MIKNETKEKVASINSEIESLEIGFKKEFEREQTEYDYMLSRTRKNEKEKRALLVAERENDLHEKEVAKEKEKEDCINRIAEIDLMQKRAESIQKLLDEARSKGAEKEAVILSRTYAYNKELTENDHRYKVEALKAKYDSLKAKYDQVCNEIQDINSKLDQCNAEGRKLTSDTVRSIGGINILNSERSIKKDN